MFRHHPIATTLVVVYFVALCWIALGPRADGHSTYLGGVIMFLPLGPLVVALLGRRHWFLALSLGVVASIWTQLACIVLRPDGMDAAWDLSANLLGVAVGIAIAVAIGAVVDHRSHNRDHSFTFSTQRNSSELSAGTPLE